MPDGGAGYLLHDSTLEAAEAAELAGSADLVATAWSERENMGHGARVLLWLGDEQVRDLAPMAMERDWEIGLLPHPEAHHACTALGVKGEVSQLLFHYQSAPTVQADALMCNGELVFSSVVIGRVLSLRPYDINRRQTGWSMLRGALGGLDKLGLSAFSITTAKEQEITLAALGLVAVGHSQSTLVGRRFDDDLGSADGRLSLLALAPRSVLSYLWFILHLLLPGKIRLDRLPPSLGLIQSKYVRLSAEQGFEYLVDGKPVHANEMELQVLAGKLRLLPGPVLQLREEGAVNSDRETVRLNHIPADAGARPLAGKHLPLFSHASEEEYRELFRSLRENARPTSSFQVLMVLSVMLALAGMYANSAPVIIGAMILAPLMSPIISLAMGLARSEPNLIRQPLKTLAVGVGWGLGCALLLAWLMPFDVATDEMKSRMSPTLLDLFVAVISGMAGAYAHAKEEIAKSLAGVAIAVALVPPLSVAGIGLGWGDWAMASGALLLLTTNLVGIALAASITFLVLGFAPFKRARMGLTVSLALLAVISAPLYIAYDHLVQKGQLQERVPSGEFTLLDQQVHVSGMRVQLGSPPLVSVVVSSPERLDSAHIDELKRLISEGVGQTVQLEVQLNIRR